MTRKGPLLTLLGGGVLGVALLVASVSAASREGDPAPAAAGQQSETAAASPTAQATQSAEPALEEPVTYVGSVDEGGASVAIVINGEEATAYVCDGDTVEAWLSGEARNGELLLSGDDGTLTGSYDADQADGETEVQGRGWTFTIGSVAPPEGLYQVADTIAGGAEVAGGWIILPDGTQVGLLTVDGQTTPAPALDPDTGEVAVGGETLTTERVG